jgi:anti-sigma B factor antagonist
VVRPQAEIVDDKTAVVEIDGPLDSTTSPGVEDYVNILLGKDIKHVLLDGEKMKYVSSEGIGLLLYLGKKISEMDGILVFFNLTVEIYTLFSLIGFDVKYLIANSRQDAFSLLEKEIDRRKSGAGENFGTVTVRSMGASVEGNDEGVKARKDFGPLVIECANCGSLIRVKKSGKFRCPDCNTGFTAMPDQSVIF